MAIADIQTFISRGRRAFLLNGTPLPENTTGACLFADISGFTPLTETLEATLGPQQGAEVLTALLNRIFEMLIFRVHYFGGDVLGFAGDAMTCWFADSAFVGAEQEGAGAMAAIACALAMQRKMKRFSAVPTPDGQTHALAMKIGISYGPVRRLLIGDPNCCLTEVLTGDTVDRMAAAEHYAGQGEILCASEILPIAGAAAAWGEDRAGFRTLQAVDATAVPPRPRMEKIPDLSPELLRPYFPPALFEWLRGTESRFLAELRPVVSAFVRFTGLDYAQDPQIGDKLNQYVSTVQQLAFRYGGNVIRLDYGDKGSVLHVVFGAPVAHEDDEVRAVGWALEVQAAVREMPFIAGQAIGMTRGRVYAGALGATTRRGYTLMGDEVNISARLMQACQLGQILVSPRIMHAAQKRYMFHQFPGFQVKGKYGLIPVATPVAPLPAMQQLMPVGPTVGRERELAQMEAVLEALSAGTGGILHIEGSEGVGKSRLAAELVQRAMQRGVRTLVGNGQSVGRATPYLPWREVLRTLFGLQGAWPAVQQAMQIQTMLQWINPEWAPRVPLLGDLLGLEIPDTPVTAAFDARMRQQSLFALLSDLLAHMSRQQPLLVLIEDSHWADDASLALIEALALRLAGAPVLLVITQRPASDLDRPLLAALGHAKRYTRLDLDELSPDAVRTLVMFRLGGEVPADVLALIQERAQGNPLFVEEFTETLRETACLQMKGGHWTLVGSIDGVLSLPETIQGVVLSRLDRVDEADKLTLKVASVVGRSFEVPLVADVHPGHVGKEALDGQLADLGRRDLVLYEQREPVAICRFKHKVSQEVVYATLLYAQRRDLHRSVATWYEDTRGTALSSYYTLLAHHCQLAEERDKERHYARLAGEQAAAQYANTEALQYLGRAFELTPEEDLAGRYHLVRAREKVYDLLGKRQEQQQDLAALQGLAEALGDDSRRAEVALRQANYAEATGDYPAAISAAQAAVALSRAAGNAGSEAAAYRQWGRMLWLQGEHKEAHPLLEKAMAQARAADLPRVEADSLLDLGTVTRRLGDYAGAQAYYEQAWQLYQQVGDCVGESKVLHNLGNIFWRQGNLDKTRAHLEQALQICREIGDRRGEAFELNTIGVSFCEQGDYSTGVTYFEQNLQICREIGDRLNEAYTLNNIGFAQRIQGKYAQSRAQMERARQNFHNLGNLRDEGIVLSNLGLTVHQQGDQEAAREYSRQALAIARQLGDQATEAEAWTHLGHAQVALGQWAEAAESYEKAVAIRRDLGEQNLVCESLAGLAQVALVQGDTARAKGRVEEILKHLESGTLDGTNEPLRVYLTCYQVLAAGQDPRAQEILKTAHDQLVRQAAQLGDPEARRTFMEDIAVHRDIVSEYRRYPIAPIDIGGEKAGDGPGKE